MPGIITIVLAIAAVIAVVAILGFAAHLLFSPWLLLVAAALGGWLFLRRRRARR